MTDIKYKIEKYLGREFDGVREIVYVDNHDGQGQLITEWNAPEAQPTQEEINAVDASAEEALAKVRSNRTIAYPHLPEFAEAYCEKEIGDDTTKWDAYVVKYNKVRSDNSK